MKLPKNRKERIQMLVLIVLGVAGVLFAIVQLGVAPLIKDSETAQETISSVKKKLKKATKDINRTKADKLDEKRRDIRESLRKIDEQYIVKADYAAYRLAVTPIVERAAKIAGVQLRQHSAIGDRGQFGVVRGKKDKFKRVFKGFKVQVSGMAGYEDLVEMFQILETENPYVIISDISITRSGNKRSHNITFTISWPIWQNAAMAKSFAAEKEKEKEDEDEKPTQG